jgi:hypothetical protein
MLWFEIAKILTTLYSHSSSLFCDIDITNGFMSLSSFWWVFFFSSASCSRINSCFLAGMQIGVWNRHSTTIFTSIVYGLCWDMRSIVILLARELNMPRDTPPYYHWTYFLPDNKNEWSQADGLLCRRRCAFDCRFVFTASIYPAGEYDHKPSRTRQFVDLDGLLISIITLMAGYSAEEDDVRRSGELVVLNPLCVYIYDSRSGIIRNKSWERKKRCCLNYRVLRWGARLIYSWFSGNKSVSVSPYCRSWLVTSWP